MALVLTSPAQTIAIDSNDAIYYATAHGVGGYIYLTYTKGDETAIQVTLNYQTKTLNSTTYYTHVTSYAGTLRPTAWTLNETGAYRIPYTIGAGEKRLKLSFSAIGGTPTGTIAIDISDGD
jgi:hypothetical protein